MESVIEVVQTPLLLGLVLLIELVTLMLILMAREPAIDRGKGADRRRRKNRMPNVPFHDSNGVLVKDNRRIILDRRHARLLALQQKRWTARFFD